MRPCEVRQSWAIMAGAEVLANLLDRRGIKQALWEIDEDTLNELRETIGRLALAAVLPLAVAEERAECAKVAEALLADSLTGSRNPLLVVQEIAAAIRSRGEPR